MKKENDKPKETKKQILGRGLASLRNDESDSNSNQQSVNDKPKEAKKQILGRGLSALINEGSAAINDQQSAQDQDQVGMTLIKKIQSEDLGPIEIALTYEQLMEDFGLSLVEIAKRIGKDRSAVINYLNLLKLDPVIQSGVRDNSISLEHAWRLVRVKSIEDQKLIYDDILNKNLSIRQTVNRIRAFENNGTESLAEILQRFERLESLSDLDLDKAIADKINSLKFCNSASSAPLKELSIDAVQSFNLGSEVHYSDFNEKTLSKLISGQISVILAMECSSLSYVEGSAYRPLTREDKCEFISGNDRVGLGELYETKIVAFGEEVNAEDIKHLGIEFVNIEIYQNVTGYIVKLIERWMKDEQWREEIAESGLEDANLSIYTSEYSEVSDEMGAYCHIDEGGIGEGVHGVFSLGYSIDSFFAITSTYNMNDRDWSGTFYFANPKG